MDSDVLCLQDEFPLTAHSQKHLKSALTALTLPQLLQKTARDCIAHLKAGRLAPMTFLPLNTITSFLYVLGGFSRCSLVAS